MKSATAVPTPATLQDKFILTEQSMNNRLVERATIIKTALVALVAKAHVFYLGSPGTAKSMSIRTLVKHIDGFERADYFERLLTAFSTDADVFGPPDLIAMEQGVFRTVTDNKLVPSLVAFIDEIWKSNDATVNSLLTAFNERVFHNDVIMPMDLWTVYCASNELPQSTELAAIYDRLHFRHVIKPIQESSSFVQMLKNRHLGPVVPTLTKDDIIAAQAEAAKVVITDEVYDGLRDLRGDLHAEHIEPTDRRWSECLPIIQATAWWRGGTEAEIDDMRLIRHMLWTVPDEESIVTPAVLQLSSPLEAEAMQKRDDVLQLAEDFDRLCKDSDNDQQRNKRAIELHSKLDRLSDEVMDLEKRIAGGGRSSELLTEVKQRVLSMTDYMLENVFHIDPNKLGNR